MRAHDVAEIEVSPRQRRSLGKPRGHWFLPLAALVAAYAPGPLTICIDFWGCCATSSDGRHCAADGLTLSGCSPWDLRQGESSHFYL